VRRAILAATFVVVSFPIAVTNASAAVAHGPAVVRHVGNGSAASTNWSGYAAFASGTTFTDVKGSWVAPSVTCPSGKAQYSSFWVGIDGYNSNSVEQTGTDSDCSGKNRASYYAWYEMYPAASVQISSLAVHPGDTMSAEISRSGTTYTLTIRNATTGRSFTTTKSQAGLANSSAEWVAEAPSLCRASCQIQPLANFGTVNFSGSFATGNGHTGSISDSAWTNDSITMVTNGGTVKAQPSALSSSGTAFSVTWKHS
jgi:peptidase A4-like protein